MCNKSDKNVMSRNEAAHYLCISVRKLDLLTAASEVKRVKLGEGKRARVLYRLQDLDDFLKSNLVADKRTIRETVRKIME